MDYDVIRLMQEGEAAARQQRRAEARRAFRAALNRDPTNATAWLWMTWLSDDPRASLAYANRALALDPDNARAKAAQRWAQSRLETPAPQAAGAAELLAPEPRRRWGRLLRIAALGALGALIAGVLLFAIWQAPQRLPLMGIGGATPASTPTAETMAPPASLTPSPSPTSTSTVTSAPTETDTPTETATSSPTATPTATPSPTLTPTASPTPTPTASPTPTLLPSPTPTPDETPSVPEGVEDEVRWINVDLSEQRLTAYEGYTPVRSTLVSTGLPRTPTLVGQYRIYIKLLKTDMRGPGYHIRDVPYTMYYDRGYGIHGAPWHSNFGQRMSAGCINLPVEEARWLFHWASVGTLVNIHD